MRTTLSAGSRAIYRFPKTGSDNARIIINSTKPDIKYDLHLVIDVYYNDGDTVLIVSDSNITDLSTVSVKVKIIEASTDPSHNLLVIELANDVNVTIHKVYGKGSIGDFSSSGTDLPYKVIYNTIPSHLDSSLYLYYINNSSGNDKYILETGSDIEFKTVDSFKFIHDTSTSYTLMIQDSMVLGPIISYWDSIDNSQTHPFKINVAYDNQGILFTGDTSSSYSPVLAAWDISISKYIGALKFYYGDVHLMTRGNFAVYTNLSTLNDDTDSNKIFETDDVGVWMTQLVVDDKITTDNLKVNISTSLEGLNVNNQAYFANDVTIAGLTRIQNSLGVDDNLSVGGSLNVSGTKNAAVPRKNKPKNRESRIFCAALESPFQSGVYYILRDININGRTKVKIPKIFLETINPETITAFIQVRGKNPSSISYTIKGDDIILYPESFYSIRVNILLWARRWDNQEKEDLAYKTYKKFYLNQEK